MFIFKPAKNKEIQWITPCFLWNESSIMNLT